MICMPAEHASAGMPSPVIKVMVYITVINVNGVFIAGRFKRISLLKRDIGWISTFVMDFNPQARFKSGLYVITTFFGSVPYNRQR